MSNIKLIKVAVGIITRNHNILLSLRPAHKDQGNLWEFPGGKIEAFETNFEALARELVEELGIQIKLAFPWPTIYHAYPNYMIELFPWLVLDFEGELKGLENQRLQWFPQESLSKIKMPEANKKLISLFNILLSKNSLQFRNLNLTKADL